MVLRSDRCGFSSFLFSISYDWKGLERKWENGYFSPGVFWAAEKWVETLSLVSLLFASSSILDFFFFALFLGCFSCQEMGERGTGDNSYYFVVNVMLYPDMMVFVVLFVLVSLNFVNA